MLCLLCYDRNLYSDLQTSLVTLNVLERDDDLCYLCHKIYSAFAKSCPLQIDTFLYSFIGALN